MLGSIFSSIGGSIGKFFGGGILSSIGRYAGNMMGSHLEKKWFGREETVHKFTNIKDSFHIAKAQYGKPIPLVFGKMRVPGKIIWADQMSEKHNTSSISRYFKSQNLTVNKEVTELEYYFSCAFAICEGEIIDIEKVWLGDEQIDINQYKFRLYKGDHEQMPDPIIEESNPGQTPAYRGLAYIVFQDLPLSDFNDVVPIFSFEVLRKSNIKNDNSAESLVKSMIMIPGSGEYVYDTEVQKKTRVMGSGEEISSKVINSHNHYSIANSLYSLNQMQSVCQNVEWVSPVVTWFGDSLDAQKCKIQPAIEFRDYGYSYSQEWKVSKYDRNNAYEISKDKNGNPNYGGSVNDGSVLRYLQEIKKRNLKIMFYPMFFLDVNQKPWRGHLTCSPDQVKDFFRKESGYNDFILHYANLVKDHVDAFVIGSEMIGLTKIKDSKNNFPAVDELISLAEKVKSIVGSKVIVTYAADWSEYHHTDGGWYNLDPLWSCPAIDVIGIDAYFPATNSKTSNITKDDLKKGWNSGEGYDYYIDQFGKKQNLNPEYAWKNLGYWWKNFHINPDGNKTSWSPCSKKIWFTEFGFPSIDKASNKPNVFFDPKSIDGGVPTYSSGKVDFEIQRKSIRAFLEYWGSQEYIEEIFLWTWDARPYPAWPHNDVWSDGDLWEKGHWVNDKFGLSNLSSILLEFSNRCGINLDKVDIDDADQVIEGVVFSNQITVLDAINMLRAAYFFDICSNNKDIISFKKRGSKKDVFFDSKNCLKLSNNNFIEEIDIPQESTLGKIDLYFMDRNKEYKTHYCHINNERDSYANNSTIRFPISMNIDDANGIGEVILKNAQIEDRIIKFAIYSLEIKLKPADFVIFKHYSTQYSIRIINVDMEGKKAIITAIIDERNSYFYNSENKVYKTYVPENKIDENMVILDLPILSKNYQESCLIIYAIGLKNTQLYSRFYNDLSSSWDKVMTLKNNACIGKIISFKHSKESNIFLTDEKSEIILTIESFENYDKNEYYHAIIGQEIIAFKEIIKLHDNVYKISHLIRGQYGTDRFTGTHINGEDFVILNKGKNILPVSKKLIGQTIEFKASGLKRSIIYNDKSIYPLRPYIIENKIESNCLYISWIMRIKDDGNWKFCEQNEFQNFQIKIHSKGNTHSYSSSENKISIDITNLTISDDYKVDIIAMFC